MATYRVEYTSMQPGGARYRECDLVRGTLKDVRSYFDAQDIWGYDPIVVVEHTESDGYGRIVPASEWDTCEAWEKDYEEEE